MANKVKIITVLVVLISVIASIIQFSVPRHVDILNTTKSIDNYLIDDSMYHKGTSSSEINRSQPNIEFECTLTSDYQWPFCEYDLELASNYEQGLNLEKMSNILIAISVDYNGKPLSTSPIRIYLKQYDKKLVVADNIKINQIEFKISDHFSPIELPLEHVEVPNWWRMTNAKAIELEQSFVDLNNVVQLGISTPNLASPGHYKFVITELSVNGTWFSEKYFAYYLLCLWLIYGIWLMAHSYVDTRKKHNVLAEKNFVLSITKRKYKRLAKFDPLTGALNRRGSQINLAESYTSAMTIIYLDIDMFKPINDVFGHSVGDKVLSTFGTMILNVTDGKHRFVRWGGEEFIIFYEGKLNDGIQLANQIQAQMKTTIWPHGEKLTCSIGIAESKENQIISDVIELADEALYFCKSLGRNRIEVARQ